MTYLYNAWYMAAWSAEVSDGFMTRTLLDIPVMLYRTDDERVIAMHDACPHRFAPLSAGTLVDGKVRCGYHGLEFNADGQCVGSCIGGVAPKAARVRTFPVVEQDTMIWIWMGDQPPADPEKIMRFPFIADPGLPIAHGTVTIKANYLLVTDNLMDLTHVAMLHASLNSMGGEVYAQPEYLSRDEAEDIVSEYIWKPMPSMGHHAPYKALDVIRWRAPGSHELLTRLAFINDAAPPIDFPSAHVVTPETKNSTHDFWASVFSDEAMLGTLKNAFEFEDKPMLEAVQKRMGDLDLFDMKPLLLATDASAVRVRRKLSAMIQRELASGTLDTPSEVHNVEEADRALSL